jgi:methyltransferase
LRHPNYAIVIGEIAALPLAFGLPLYALVFSVFNGVILTVRIRAENAALSRTMLQA